MLIKQRSEAAIPWIEAVLSAFSPELVKTITCDRGTEFANWRSIEQTLGYDVYFADPY